MIESIMYLGIGFLVASISVLAVVPIVHQRAVRLTTRKIEDTIPSSVAEIAADKDLLRAEFAISTRSLEMKVDQLKSKDATQLLQLGRNGNTIHHLRTELDTLRDRLQATDEQLVSESAALKVAEHALSATASELATLKHDLAQQSIVVDGQTIEIVTLKTQVESLNVQLDTNKNELQAVNDCRDAEQIEFQARAKELTGELRSTERALSDKEAELDQLSRDFRAQAMVNDAQETKIVALDCEIEALRQRLGVTTVDLRTAEDDRDELTLAIKETGVALFAKESEAVRLAGELSEHATLGKAQANEISGLQAEVETLTGRLDETCKALNAKESEAVRLTGELGEHASHGKAQANEIFGLRAEVETLNGRLDETCKALNAKESEAVRLVGELSEHATLGQAQTNEISDLKAEVETLTARLDETCKALNRADDRTYGLAAAVHKAGLVVSERDREIAKLVGERNERSTLVQSQANEVLAFNAENETLTARFDEARKALHEAAARGQVLAAAGEKSEQALSEKRTEIAELVDELNDRTTLAQSQENEIIGLKAEVETLTGRLDEACKALSASEDRSQALAAAAEKSERQLSERDPEFAKLIVELNERSTLAKAQGNEILGLKAEVETLTGRLDEAHNALNAAEDRSQELAVAGEKSGAALSEKQSEIAKLMGELNDRSALSQAQANEIICLKAEVETLVGRFDEASKARNAAEDRSRTLAIAAETAAQVLSVKEAEAAKLAGQLNDRSTLADAQANDILDLKTEVETLTARLDETSKTLDAAEDRGETLAATAEKAELALSAKEAEAVKLAGELDERSLLADKQTKELAALKVYLGALKERLDVAEKELQTADERRAAERLELDSAIQQMMDERTKFVSFHGRVSELVEQLLAQSRADKNLARRARELETRLAEQTQLLEASELERNHLREEIEAALKTEAERRTAMITEIDNSAKAEKAKLQAALDRANGDRTRLVYELANAKRQVEASKGAERPEGIVAA
jgi:chromosome segregation ATPase